MPVLFPGCFPGGPGRGCPCPESRAVGASVGRMPERSGHAASGGHGCHPRASGDGAGQPRPTQDVAEVGRRRTTCVGQTSTPRTAREAARPPKTLALQSDRAPGVRGMPVLFPGGQGRGCPRPESRAVGASVGGHRSAGGGSVDSERPATGLGRPDPRRTWPKSGAAGHRAWGRPQRHARLAGTLALQGRSPSRDARPPGRSPSRDARLPGTIWPRAKAALKGAPATCGRPRRGRAGRPAAPRPPDATRAAGGASRRADRAARPATR
jgi:hypothetical protein